MNKNLLVLIFLLFFLANAYSYDEVISENDVEYNKEKGEKIVEGLHFDIAEDRRIERTGKYFTPEGLDKYFNRKFDNIQMELNKISERLSAIENKLSLKDQE